MKFYTPPRANSAERALLSSLSVPGDGKTLKVSTASRVVSIGEALRKLFGFEARIFRYSEFQPAVTCETCFGMIVSYLIRPLGRRNTLTEVSHSATVRVLLLQLLKAVVLQ